MARKTTSLELYKRFLEEISGNQPKPVYAFFGDESFFLDHLQKAAIAIIPQDARDFNLDILYGSETKIEQVTGICRSYPMMSEKRVVVVRDFMKMFTDTEDTSKLKNESNDGQNADPGNSASGGSNEDLVAYLKNPVPTTLLFLSNKNRPPATTKLGAALKNGNSISSHTFEPVLDYQLEEWITDWAKIEHNLDFEENAAQFLGLHVGNNLQFLTIEIEKLYNFCKGGRAVTIEDVREVTGLSREYSMFDLQDALFERNQEKSMMIAYHMLTKSGTDSGGEVFKIIGFLYTSFSKIWIIQRLLHKGLPQNKIQLAVKTKSSFYYDKLLKAGSRYPLSECPLVFETLLDADKAMKGLSRQAPEAILLMTIKKLTN